MKCRPAQSVPDAHSASQISITSRQSSTGSKAISLRNSTQAIANETRR